MSAGVTAAWPLDSLVSALGRAGWGVLADRSQAGQRTVLRALVDLLPHGSAQGKTTAAQIADAAGLSVRWTRSCLHALEAAGFIVWRRGWLDRGRPMPGVVRVSKTAIALAVRAARKRDQLAERNAARAAALRERIRGLSLLTQRPKPTPAQQHPLSVRAELASAPLFHREGPAANGAAVHNPKGKTNTMNQSLLCRHGFAGRCPKCITQNQPYQRQLGPAGAATGGKEPTCRACARTRASHDAANALVAPSLRHDWDR